MYLTEKARTLQPYEIDELKTMKGMKYGEFRGTRYRQSRDNDWIEIDYEYNPQDRVNVKTTVRIDKDTISATLRISVFNKVVYERSSKGTSLSRYGVINVVVRMFLQNLSDLIGNAYDDSYFMCHMSTGNDPMYSDYWKLLDEDYLDSQVSRLKRSIERLNNFIDRF